MKKEGKVSIFKRIREAAYKRYMKKYNGLKFNSLAISEGVTKLNDKK